ncbi:MAG: ABC transporter permease, partial [Acidobacteriaceae bacterium]|nr:ABC transporter permease [Acidobacteriaceae bacterium]
MNWRRSKKREEDLRRELDSHLELEAEEREAEGLSQPNAAYAARRALGNITRVAEDARAVWTGMFFERLWQDMRFSFRAMRRYPAATVTAIVTLALGTGANTAIFSIVNTVLIRPLPYRDADRLMTVWSNNRSRGFNTEQVSLADFTDWKSQSHVFEELAASTDAMYTLTGAGEPVSVIGYEFSSNFFHVLGAEPLLGRTFLPDEQQPGKDHVVVLGHRLWQSRFAGDPTLIGKTIRLDGAPYTVIGIMPQGVDYPGSVELWTPLVTLPQAVNERSYRFLRVLG